MRSITTLDLQYAHRFYGFKGEAQYLHGHTGILTIEVEDSVEPGVNMVFPCNEIQKTAWALLKNFDHALILREDDPLLPAILGVYEAQGIRITKASASPKASKAARAFQKLVAMGQRLMSVIRKSEGIPNKDLDRFARDIQSLCDKWDRDDI